MPEIFRIYIDRLRQGKTEILKGSASPSFLEVSDGNLLFQKDVEIEGSCYIAEDHLVLHLDVHTLYQTRCKICNEFIEEPFSLKGLYLTEELEKITSRIYNFESPLRDAILLEIPLYSECAGWCNVRNEIKQFMKTEMPV